MVLGVDNSIEILNDHPELEAYFIYNDENGELKSYMTEGFRAYLRTEN
jgi:thiamine biosynthesis lipoprotein